MKRIIIIGGGITGLSAAHRLLELAAEKNLPIEVMLLEAGDQLGGVIRTVKRDGYLCEAGPENFVTNKPGGMALCRRLGLTEQILPTNDAFRRALIVHRNRLLPIPEGFLLLAPTKIWPMVVTPLFSWPGKLRMALEYFLPARKVVGEDESLASFVIRRFGREALDRAVQPLIGGIYTADPQMLSLRATMPMFLDMEQKHGSVIRAMRKQSRSRLSGSPATSGAGSGARYSLFVTLRDGMDTLPRELARRIGAPNIRTGARVATVRQQEGRWLVRLDSDEALAADAVIITGPSRAAAAMLRQLDDDLASRLADVPYATSAVAHLAYRRTDVPHPLDAFGYVVPAIENRQVMAVSFTSVKYERRAPDGFVLLRAFLGGAMNPQIMQRDDAGLIDAAREDFRDLLHITAAPEMTMVHRWPDSMPQYRVGHLAAVAAIRKKAAEYPGLDLAGNGFEGVGIPDCIAAGEQAAQRMVDTMGKWPSAQ